MAKSILMLIRNNRKETDKSIINHNGLTHASMATYKCLKDNEKLKLHYSTITDNTQISDCVYKHNPDYVVIDGLWLIPEKFKELKVLHPSIKWIFRLHSDIGFIAQEGVFANWFYKYLVMDNVYVTFNSTKLFEIMRDITHPYSHKVLYLPNTYPLDNDYRLTKTTARKSDVIRISSFGAARILKNHFAQAVAALEFAEKLGKSLEFYININGKDPGGLPIYLNIVHILKGHFSGKHKIKLIEWTNHVEFMESIKEVDIAMQVSLSETFNLVSCDSLMMNTPIIGTNEIPWIHPIGRCYPTDHDSIMRALWRAYRFPKLNVMLNSHNLIKYSNKSIKQWEKLFTKDLVK
jgi:hypothetical protein